MMYVKAITRQRWDVLKKQCTFCQIIELILTRMWADAQRDGRPAEYRWRPLQKFLVPFLVPRRSLAEARCWSAMQ